MTGARPPMMKVRQVKKLLRQWGFEELPRRGKGDHSMFRLKSEGRTVSVDGALGQDIRRPVLFAMMKQAGAVWNARRGKWVKRSR